jgi:hypothetical protein
MEESIFRGGIHIRFNMEENWQGYCEVLATLLGLAVQYPTFIRAEKSQKDYSLAWHRFR